MKNKIIKLNIKITHESLLKNRKENYFGKCAMRFSAIGHCNKFDNHIPSNVVGNNLIPNLLKYPGLPIVMFVYTDTPIHWNWCMYGDLEHVRHT